MVEDLLSSLEEEKIPQPQAANIGIDDEWLELNAKPAIDEYASVYFSMAAANQQELYFSFFKDIRKVEKLLPSIFRGGWTDDHPYVKVEITYNDGQKVIAQSDSQPSFMLPWEIDRNGEITKTYNAKISKAVASLLPKKFANKDRLSGTNLNSVLARAVMRAIEVDWKRLEAENRASSALDKLREEFDVVSSEINSNHDSDFGKEWAKGTPTQTNLHVLLRKPSFPDGFAIKVILPFRDQKVSNVELFLQRIDKYLELINSVSWLKDYRDNKGKNIWLRFVNERSFSDKAMKSFSADMNKLGKNDLITDVLGKEEGIAMISVGGGLEYYQSSWLVLPDGRVILWRDYHGNLLKWSSDDFQKVECSEPRSNSNPCVGALISREGQIISK